MLFKFVNESSVCILQYTNDGKRDLSHTDHDDKLCVFFLEEKRRNNYKLKYNISIRNNRRANNGFNTTLSLQIMSLGH